MKTADIYGNFGEIELNQGSTAEALLPKIFNNLQLRSFSIEAPTLNRIFIDTIKKTGE
ncbi:MAG: DUF4162 domain-containing protein [Ignavibacteriales bacterium]|nr:DUF4162 domain-containing protein [Ignavibacteriales bacterium]